VGPPRPQDCAAEIADQEEAHAVMHVTLLGTGCPQVHTRRFGPASLVGHGEQRFLIDCGSGVTQRLVGAGTSGAALDALLLTHLHSDHLVDLYQLIVSSWHQGRDRPQRLFGPRGTKAFVEATMAAWEGERALRIQWECRPSTAALELEITEFEEGVLWEADDLRISAFQVDHRPVEPAFGFLFESAACRVAFSGDTTVCDTLVRAAHGVDLLVHECFIHQAMLARRGGRGDRGLANVAAYHTLSSAVGKVASRTGAGMLVLNHFVPVEFDRAALLAEVRADYAGPVIIGEDLLTVDVPNRALSCDGLTLGLGSGAQAEGESAGASRRAPLPRVAISAQSATTRPSAAGRPKSSASPPSAGGPIRKPT
jgi:ribonuclease Z